MRGLGRDEDEGIGKETMHWIESMAKRFHGFLAGEKSTGWRR